MNRLTAEKRAQVVAALVEGNSIRSTCRMTGVAKGTVTKLLVDLGEACSAYMNETLIDLPCQPRLHGVVGALAPPRPPRLITNRAHDARTRHLKKASGPCVAF